MSPDDREWALFTHHIDPHARTVIAAADPWTAYAAAAKIPATLLDDLASSPHGGAVYTTWAELADIYETGKTPIPDAHTVLRHAAKAWLERPSEPNSTFLDDWLRLATDAITHLYTRDGGFGNSLA
ncbi:hypothetical protein ACWEOE_09005 [Amycolatopsis sp. NPDC004368]